MVYKELNKFVSFGNVNPTEHPGKNFLEFDIWGSSPLKKGYVVASIFNKRAQLLVEEDSIPVGEGFTTKVRLITNDEMEFFPTAYLKSGNYFVIFNEE